MKTMSFILTILFLVPVACAAAAAKSVKSYTLENKFMSREISTSGTLHTVSITNKLTGKKFALKSDEFAILLGGASKPLTAKDFKIDSFKKIDTGCEYVLTNKKSGVTVTVKYTLAPDEFWTRKQITVDAGGKRVDVLDVERFSIAGAKIERFDTKHESRPPWDWPGGRPLFVSRQLFAGLEYPAGHNEADGTKIMLRHYPGRKGQVTSKTAVIGVASDKVNSRVEDAFAEYISRIRIHPPRRFVLWNAYFNKYDGLGGAAYAFSDAYVKKKIIAGRKTFNDVGVKLESTLIDGGWTDPQSLMEEDRRAPGRVGKVAEYSQKYLEAPIGVHVITHGRRNSIDKEWLKKNFDMIDDKAYCFADPRATDLQIKNLLDLQKKHHLVAFKFDWGAYVCGHADHRGHIAGENFGREAITDNQIRMLSALHDADPEVFLYNTGWYSPWWLMYYDAVFSGENDFNTTLTGTPQFDRNNIMTTWRDEVIVRNLVSPHPQFPLSSLMNHSPITFNWVHDPIKSDQGSLRSYANTFLMEYLRGTMLIEFYMNVFNMTEEQRQLWGAITKWARANDDILLANTKFIGGEPFRAEVYGFAHFDRDNDGLIGIRNPGIVAKPFKFKLDEKAGFISNGAKYEVRIAFPFEKVLGQSFKYGDTVSLEIPRQSVVVLQTAKAGKLPSAGSAAPDPGVGKPIYEKVNYSNKNGRVAAEYKIASKPSYKTSFVALVRIPSAKDQKSIKIEAKLNGTPVEAQRMENLSGNSNDQLAGWELGDGWVLFTIELPEGDSDLALEIAAPKGAKDFAWLMTNGPEAAGAAEFASGLPSMWKDSPLAEYILW